MKIYIADDHPIITNGLENLLSGQADFNIIGKASNGNQLLELLKEEEADVLILDLNMPGYSYIGLLKLILVYYPKMKVLIFSNYKQPELVREVIGMGVHGYLHKTSEIDDLIKGIRSLSKGIPFYGNSIRIGGHSKDQKDHVESYVENDKFLKEISLSPRERDVLILIAQGESNQAIADRLFLSKHTIETHRKKIMRKLSFKSSAELIHFAISQGMA